MFRSPTNSPATSRPFDQVTTSAFSVSRSLVSRFASRFFLHRAFAFGFVAPHVALHRVSIRTLDELSWCKLGAGWGSRGELMRSIPKPSARKSSRSSRRRTGYGRRLSPFPSPRKRPSLNSPKWRRTCRLFSRSFKSRAGRHRFGFSPHPPCLLAELLLQLSYQSLLEHRI